MNPRTAVFLRGSAASLMLGFLPAAALPAAAGESTINELKRLGVEDLMGIEVTTVNRQRERLLDAAAAVQVITQEDIRRSGATTLSEALRLADNLQVAQRGSASWAVSARGFNTELANKLLVMIDGRTVYTPLFSGVFWEAQDYLLEDVERIEVVSGPGGTLWGANAVNGVINVITRSAAASQGLYTEAAGGTELNGSAGLRYGGSISPATQFRVYGKYFDRDASVLADGASAQDDWDRGQGGFRIDSRLRESHQLTLQGDYYSNHENTRDGVTSMQGANLLGRWTHQVSSDSELSLQGYYDWSHLSDAVPVTMLGAIPIAPAGRLRDDLQTFDLDFQHQFRIGAAHGILWGLGFRNTHDVVENAPGLAFLPAELDQQLFSAFIQDEIRLRDNLSFTLGTKIEHNDYTGTEFEPSVRLQWQLAATRTLWAAVSRAIRAPSRIDRDLAQPAPPYFPVLYGSDDFRSEEVLAYELGYRAQLAPSLAFALSGFYNEYDDIRSTTITPATVVPFRFANGVSGDTWGMEFTGNLQLTGNWSMHLGYNLLEESLHVDAGEIDITSARNETSDPEQQVSLRTAVDLSNRVSMDAALRWVDTLHNNSGVTAGTVPQYLELNMRLAWQATPGLELSIVGQNLLHDQHPEYGFPGPDRIEVQRSIFGKLAWRN